MLKSMRKGAHGIFAKILLILLIASLGVWGIGDIFTGGGSNAVATVGKHKVEAGRYAQAIANMKDNFGDNYSEEIFQGLQVPQQILSALVNKALLMQESQAIGLRFTDQNFIRFIQENPNFQNDSGDFDRELFIRTLRDNQLNEKLYLEYAREEMSVSLLEETISTQPPLSNDLAKYLYMAENEKREATLLHVTSGHAGAVNTPDNAVLKEFHAENIGRYYTTPNKTFDYLVFSSDLITNSVSVDDEELQAAYEEQGDSLKAPEKRKVSQWIFADEDAAQAASEGFDADTSSDAFAALSSDASFSDLGAIAAVSLPKDAAEAVFTLKANTVSAPVQTSFGWHLFHVSEVLPAAVPAFDTVKEKLRDDLLARKREQKLQSFATELEDILAGGADIPALAEQYGVPVQSLGPVNADNSASAAAEAAERNAVEQTVIAAGATLSKKDDISPLALGPENHYYLVALREMNEARPIDFVDARKDVLADWSKQQAAETLKNHAEVLYKALENGASLADAAKQHPADIVTTKPFTRNDTVLALKNGRTFNATQGFTTELFESAKGEYSMPYPLPDGGYVIGQVESVTSFSKSDMDKGDTKADYEAYRDALAQQMNDAVFRQYMLHLQTKYPVTIHQNVIDAVLQQ